MSDFSVSSNQTLENYFKEISEYSLLSAEDEVDLARQIKQGDQGSLNRLVNANLRFVVSVAKSYQNHGLSLAYRYTGSGIATNSRNDTAAMSGASNRGSTSSRGVKPSMHLTLVILCNDMVIEYSWHNVQSNLFQ